MAGLLFGFCPTRQSFGDFFAGFRLFLNFRLFFNVRFVVTFSFLFALDNVSPFLDDGLGLRRNLVVVALPQAVDDLTDRRLLKSPRGRQ